MARDFKSAAAGGTGGVSARKPGMPPMVTGIIIGLLLGIAIALGVATWINRSPTQYLDKPPPVAPLPTMTPKAAVPPVVKAEKADPDKPRFEFYQILPGDKSGTNPKAQSKSAEPKGSPSAESKPAPSVDAGSSKIAPRAESSQIVYLQAGAFQNQTDAENLRAKIAFAGFEAQVRAVNVADKGTLYRVRLGPYQSAEEVSRIKLALAQNAINTNVVKSSD